MNPRQRAWLLVLTVVFVCGLMVLGAFWYRSNPLTPAAMLRRLPARESIVLYIDMAQLRRIGVIDRFFNSASVGQDPDYQSFVQKIDFNFRTDLDSAMLAIAPTGKFLLARGRFDWPALNNFVSGQGGHCNNAVCNLVGSAPERRISFFPLQKGLMALAVSPEENASDRLHLVDQRTESDLPSSPIWLMIPQSVLQARTDLPPGTKMFAEKMERADRAIIWLAGNKDQFSAKMDVRCSNISDAVAMASDLAKVTALLRRLIESEGKIPNPADLSGFLTSGTFRNEGTHVIGEWPIQQALIETLFGQ